MRRPSACGSRSSDSARLNPRSRGRRRRRADRTAAADGPAEADLPAARAAPAFDVLSRPRSILPSPVGIAAAAQQEIVLFGGIDRTGQSWRDAWRWAQ